MKLRWMCRCTTGGERIIRLTYGNTAGREGTWCSTSSWVGDATGQRNSWVVSTEFCRPTVTPLMTRWAGRSWCMAPVGRMRGVKFYEAHQLCPGESVAKSIVLLIDDLFGIDAAARVQNLDWIARDGLRQQQARPLLETIRQKIEAAR